MDQLEKDKKDMKELNELLDEAINEVLQDTSAEFNINTDPSVEPDYGYYGTVDSPDTFDLGKFNKTPKGEERRHYPDENASKKRFEGPFTGRDKKPTQTINWTEQFDRLEKEMKQEKANKKQANKEQNLRNFNDFKKEPSYQYQTEQQVDMKTPQVDQSYQFRSNNQEQQNIQKAQKEPDFQHPLDQQMYNQAGSKRLESFDTLSSTTQLQTKRIIERPYQVEKSEYDSSPSGSHDLTRPTEHPKEGTLNQRMKEHLTNRFQSKSNEAAQGKKILFNNDYFQRESIPQVQRKPDSDENDRNAVNSLQQQRPKLQRDNRPELKQEAEVVENKPAKKPEYFEYQGKKCTTQDPGGTVLNCPPILRRNVWGALPSMKQLTPMKPPAEAVVFSLDTETPPCRDTRDCMRKVKEIQARHMGRDLGDIQYNFLVGGDGQLYEGRGWAYESGAERKEGEGPNINVAFIGKYSEDPNQIPSEMITPVHDLIMWATVNKLLTGNAVRQEALPPKSNE